MNRNTFLRAACACIAALSLWPAAVMAQAWPNKPIQVMIPIEAGSGIDAIARYLAPPMEKALGQRLVFINKGGAAGALGTEIVARSQPNGYTILLTANAPLEVIPAFRRTGYDPVKDFKPIGLIAAFPSFFVVPASLGINTMPEFLALARSKPGVLNYASSGLGSTSNLNIERMMLAAGIKAAHVPFKGGGEVQQAMLGGVIDFTATTGSNVLPHIRSGKFKLLAISSADLASLAPPGTPAISDFVPGVRWKGWYGLLAPAGTPDDVIARFRAALAVALKDPAVKESLAVLGAQAGSGEDLAEMMREGLQQTKQVIADTKMKLE